MPAIADEKLLKVTLNLYAKDIDYLKAKTGFGYSETIRRLVRKHVRILQELSDDTPGER